MVDADDFLPEPALADEVMGDAPGASEPRGKPKSPTSPREEGGEEQIASIADSLVEFCVKVADGNAQPPTSSPEEQQSTLLSSHESQLAGAPEIFSLHAPASSSAMPGSDDVGGVQNLTLGSVDADQKESEGGKRERQDDGEAQQEGKRARRRSSALVCYAEPSISSKLRQGCANTFNSGYDTGIKTFSLAEQKRVRDKKAQQQRRQSLAHSLSAPLGSQ